jgi:cell wall-associated NlpC family hydrolase
MPWASFKLFNSDAQLTAGKTNTTTARLMFMHLAEVTEPQPGDLAFYARSASTDVAHVMMVTDKGGVIGACDEAGQVNEYPRVAYTTRWTVCGY